MNKKVMKIMEQLFYLWLYTSIVIWLILMYICTATLHDIVFSPMLIAALINTLVFCILIVFVSLYPDKDTLDNKLDEDQLSILSLITEKAKNIELTEEEEFQIKELKELSLTINEDGDLVDEINEEILSNLECILSSQIAREIEIEKVKYEDATKENEVILAILKGK